MAIPYSTSSDSTSTIEEWRDIPGYEGVYQASDLGRVRRMKSVTSGKAGAILRFGEPGNGYRQVTLSIGGKRTRYLVHRLILMVWGRLPQGNEQVNHINGIKDDNRLVNLEWVDASSNQKHSYNVLGRVRGQGEFNSQRKLSDNDVRKIREMLNQHISKTQIAKLYSVSEGAIRLIGKGTTWNHVV